jgi:hypothetical protein
MCYSGVNSFPVTFWNSKKQTQGVKGARSSSTKPSVLNAGRVAIYY